MENEKEKSVFDKVLEFLRSPDNKQVLTFVKTVIRILSPHPVWKVVGDIIIGALCIGAVIYCADKGFIEKTNVQSLLALIIGAIVGSRFKGD